MLGHVKKLLGIGTKTQPILLSDVEPSAPDPAQDKEVKTAVAKLISSLLELERHSYDVRKELSMIALRSIHKGED
jgi:hypothetical protein